MNPREDLNADLEETAEISADEAQARSDKDNLPLRWHAAWERHRAMEMGRRKVELNSIIGPILEQLQNQHDVAALEERYRAGLEWCVEIARVGYPSTPSLWKTARTADVAFGLRYRQLTGEASPTSS